MWARAGKWKNSGMTDRSRELRVIMLFACHESYTGSPTETPYYVVAGFVGEQERWELFNSLWRDSMRELRIREIGCHASNCEGGWKEYKHLKRAKRTEIQRRLIVDIAASELYGVVSAIDMTAYHRVRGKLSDSMKPAARQYNAAHVLAVRQCVQQVCQATQAVTQELITFTVDQNKEFGKRAKAWYELSRDNPDDSHHHRFGPYFEGERKEKVGLQAADMLAYSYLRNILGQPVWQWDGLRPAVKISEFVTEASFWDRLAENFEEVARAKAS